MPEDVLAVQVEDLTYSYGGPLVLDKLSLHLPVGSRCLLVGLNGTGKSTFLRILAGKRLVKDCTVNILGQDAYHATPSGLTYLGPEWAANPVVRRDVTVQSLLEAMNAERFPERLANLLDLLDVDLEWHMHQLSDGERRRVQILLGLVEPFRVLLLDEVTVDLDVLVRKNLLQFLRKESENGATLIYATHIFDGLGDWPTQMAHLSAGRITEVLAFDQFQAQVLKEVKERSGCWDSPLLTVVEGWLRSDQKEMREKKRNRPAKSETHWDRLSDIKRFGDRYYDYWSATPSAL